MDKLPSALVLLVGLAIGAEDVAAQLPEGASFDITRGAGANTAALTLRDPGNHFWVLQSSTDLITWTNIDGWQVYNGSFHRSISFTPTEGRSAYYRMAHLVGGTNVPGTVANALRLPATMPNYASPSLPNHLRVLPNNIPSNNVVTDAGATLGRVLFYDKRLSQNRTVSCSSCHQREHGFSDPERFSKGFAGGRTPRHSMGLTNVRWKTGPLFWDARTPTLEALALQPIQNSVEMGMTLPDLVTRLSGEPFYATLFTNAFGDSTVTSDRIGRALAQFMRSIVSTQSKYDAGAPIGFTNFTLQERQGQQIFGGSGCSACHTRDSFVQPIPENNGLENPFIDKGLGAVTGRTQDEGRFRAPSLRNVALTGPYMHDGRFATLEEVVDFYNAGVVNHPNLSPILRGGTTPRRLNLTATQKAALVAFLNTLTDTSVTTDEKFSDPFNYGD